jgi:hypothetical protein
MDYHRYLRDEHEPVLVAMFEYADFDNTVEDTASFRKSKPKQEQIKIKNRGLMRNESHSLLLDPDSTEPIEFEADGQFPSSNFTLIARVSPTLITAVVGDEELDPEEPIEGPDPAMWDGVVAAWDGVDISWGTARSPNRGVITYGDLSLAVENVRGTGKFDLVIKIGNQTVRHVLTGAARGRSVYIVRSGTNFKVYINGKLVNNITQTNFATPAGKDLIIGSAPDVDDAESGVEVAVQGVSLHAVALTESQIEDIESVAESGYIVRTVVTDDVVDFADDAVIAVQGEWHTVGV